MTQTGVSRWMMLPNQKENEVGEVGLIHTGKSILKMTAGPVDENGQ